MAAKSNVVPFCLVSKVENHRALHLAFLHPELIITSGRDPSDNLLAYFVGHVWWGIWKRLTALDSYEKSTRIEKFCVRVSQIDSVKLKGIRSIFYGSGANAHTRPLHVDSNLDGSLRSLRRPYSPDSRFSGFRRLPYNRAERGQKCPSRNPIGPCYEYVPPWHVLFGVLAFVCAVGIIVVPRSRDTGDVALAIALLFVAGVMFLVGHKRYYPDDYGNGQQELTPKHEGFIHGGEIVPRKYLTSNSYWGTVIGMANVLPKDKQIACIAALTEGSSLRSIERITGIHHDTIRRLAVKVGQGCAALLDSSMRNLPCNRLEMDEIWGFVGKKDRNVREGEDGVGSVWTFCAIDAETKLVPAFKCGNRDAATAKAFVQDVASRMAYRVQISTDGLAAYVPAMESAFGEFVDYGQIIKTYGHEEVSDNRRYSAPKFVSAEKKIVIGIPDERLISTSYVERLNATTRLHMRRLTRLTLAFSKKRENFEAAVALHFAYYNFVKRHNTLRCTPAMAAGVTNSFWSGGRSGRGCGMSHIDELRDSDS